MTIVPTDPTDPKNKFTTIAEAFLQRQGRMFADRGMKICMRVADLWTQAK